MNVLKFPVSRVSFKQHLFLSGIGKYFENNYDNRVIGRKKGIFFIKAYGAVRTFAAELSDGPVTAIEGWECPCNTQCNGAFFYR